MKEESDVGQSAGADAEKSPRAGEGKVWVPGAEIRPWSLPLEHEGQTFVVYGGPYFAMPQGFFGIKLAAELNLPCQINLPIRDYSIPSAPAAQAALESCVEALFAGEKVYAGCYGGKGRTGLFLALLAKSFGAEEPIAYVRELYHPHAVETAGQADFVRRFDVSGLREKIREEAAAKRSNPKEEAGDARSGFAPGKLFR